MTRYSYDVNPDLDRRFKQYMLDTHGKVYGCQGDILRRALIEFLDRHEKKSVAPPQESESSKKEKLPPDLIERVRQYYGRGKRLGGHSRSETAREFGLSEGQVDGLIRTRRNPP